MSLPVENRTVLGYKFVVSSLVLWREDLAPGLQCLWCLGVFCSSPPPPTPVVLQQEYSSVPSLHSCCLISEPKLSLVEGLGCFVWSCAVDIGEKLILFS